ncbi:uncharacterized protein LOC117793983 [Drosophila innubila]|uniref:uncharacterized protein LOC117793983 n=1 Tax=Drosophila innubila TaxID=198719 RepID=UPI00148D6650|nr:uncharacterized protein LOC117793983 [Drosophila innubila]
MNAAVCVMVTVPTEQEEERLLQLQTKRFRYVYNCTRCRNWEQESPVPSVHSKVLQHCSRALQLPELKENAPLEQVLRLIALQLRLEHVFWSHDVAGEQLQARFDLLQDERYERLLCTLQDWGIGERPGTHVTAINCLETRVKFSSSPAGGAGAGERAGARAGAEAGAGPRTEAGEATASDQPEGQRLGWQSFMDSVRCRLNVNQVVRVVRRDATINFDFVVLLMAAALLSCVGLVEDSFLFLSSSMLISPLMGPIIAAIFGSVIGDRGLRWIGIKNELIGIAISVVTGFIFGGAICLFGLCRFFVLSAGFTEEIVSRCDTHSLAIGLCTALASGAAAAIGVLGGNTGSLVGVAISASLLPPAVNAGLLWAIALCSQLFQVDSQLLQGLSKHQDYSQQLHIELFVCATVSMALTLVNVVCVWLMGVVVLRIKEVAPAVQRDQEFWRHDVRLAREVALNDPELHNAIDRLDTSERRQVDLEAPQYQHTWSPGTARTCLQHESGVGQIEEKDNNNSSSNNYHTVHGFQDFCITLHKLKLPRPSKPALPSFMELFTPPTIPSNATPNVADMETAVAAAADTTILDFSSSSALSNHRSLPDLRLPLKDATPTCKSKLPRCVHWNEERDQRQRQFLLEAKAKTTAMEEADAQAEAETEAEVQFLPRHSGHVLLPLPLPDRRLRLLRSRSKDNSEECEYEHEYNV